jgi:hypothetical protein
MGPHICDIILFFFCVIQKTICLLVNMQYHFIFLLLCVSKKLLVGLQMCNPLKYLKYMKISLTFSNLCNSKILCLEFLKNLELVICNVIWSVLVTKRFIFIGLKFLIIYIFIKKSSKKILGIFKFLGCFAY